MRKWSSVPNVEAKELGRMACAMNATVSFNVTYAEIVPIDSAFRTRNALPSANSPFFLFGDVVWVLIVGVLWQSVWLCYLV